MVKLVALYRKPDDMAAFDRHYSEVHAPLAARMPGLRRMEVATVTGSPLGESDLHLVAEMYFDSVADVQAALGSPEGRAAGIDLMSFAKGLVTLHIAQIQ